MGIKLKPLKQDSTVARVAQAIRDEIIRGRIKQGTQLRIAPLAEMLGTSQGSVREAIRGLTSEGLIEHRPHRGAFVRVRSQADCLDVYLAREVIETWAAATILASDARLELGPLEAAIADLMSEDDRPSSAVIEADMLFHHELVRLGGSQRLTALHASLVAETKILVHHNSPWPGASYQPLHEHILDAIKARDVGLPELVANHLRTASQLIGTDSDKFGGTDVLEPHPGTKSQSQADGGKQ